MGVGLGVSGLALVEDRWDTKVMNQSIEEQQAKGFPSHCLRPGENLHLQRLGTSACQTRVGQRSYEEKKLPAPGPIYCRSV